MSKRISIRVRSVGQSFGCVGQLVARNGRVMGETAVMPYGFTSAAQQAAEALAAKMGYEVAS